MKLAHLLRNLQNGVFRSCMQESTLIHKPLLFTKRIISKRACQLGANFNKDIWNTKSVFSNIQCSCLHTSSLANFKDTVTITFVDRNSEKIIVEADVGDTLLDVAKDNDIDGVEGACGGTLACSTCHCIFHEEDFDRLELSDVSEDELDMLDLAYGLTDTSRLVCAIDVSEEMDGLEINVPVATNDARDY